MRGLSERAQDQYRSRGNDLLPESPSSPPFVVGGGGDRLIEKDREAMGILSASRGKTLSNSVCATFQKDTGKTQPEMYAKGWGKCTVGKHFVKYALPPNLRLRPPSSVGPQLMRCG